MTKTFFGIRTKLFIGFISISVIVLLSVVTSLYIISFTEKNAKEVIETELPVYNILVDLSGRIYLESYYIQLWKITNDEKFKNEFINGWQNVEAIENKLDGYIKNSKNSQLIQKWYEVKNFSEEFKTVGLKVLDLQNSDLAKNVMQSEFLPVVMKLSLSLNTFENQSANIGIMDIQYDYLNQGSQKILIQMSQLRQFEYAILVIILLTSIFITLTTSKIILTPLRRAINVAKSIANGQRKVKIVIQSNDETGELLQALDIMQKSIRETEHNLQQTESKTRNLFENIVKSANAFSQHSSKVASGDLTQHLDTQHSEDVMKQLGNDLNKMTDNLATITTEITQACQHMVTTVEEVRHAVDTQSAGASEQASSINEISASLSEIEKSSTQTMEKAKTLGQSAERTREKGQQGLEAVDQSVDGMTKIRDKVQIIAQTILDLSHQTQQVGEITAVVNNLAQQSKMLALNASIEAAKAGEAGKGFAVVAVEVKNLAEQSEQATTQVQKILESIRYATEKAVMVTEEGTKGVDEGTALVEQTGDIIRNLNDVIHETTIASQQIESAVRQEGAGIEQIATGMNEINQVTASFIESVRQTTEAINNLADIAKNLKSYIDTYKI